MNELIVSGGKLRELLDMLWHHGDVIISVVPETMEHHNGHSYVATYRVHYVGNRRNPSSFTGSLQ